jgi:protein phosphatase
MATTVIITELQQLLEKAAPYAIDRAHRRGNRACAAEGAIAKANTSIYQAAQSQPQYAGMGTTLVVCLFYDNKMTVGHLGDSRLYMLRDGKFSQVTRDHSLLQEQIDSGLITAEQAAFSANKNLVTPRARDRSGCGGRDSRLRRGEGRHLPALFRRPL